MNKKKLLTAILCVLLLITAFASACNLTREGTTFSVTYMDGDGVIKTEKLNENAVIDKAYIPVKTGYKFEGWFTDPEFKKPFSAETAVTSDMTLYAKWTVKTYTVKFLGYNGVVLEVDGQAEQTVAHGGSATAPQPPEVENKVFIGWDKRYNNVVADLTVRAVYEDKKQQAKLAFVYNGEEFYSETVEANLSISAYVNEAETRISLSGGFAFDSWYTDAELTFPANLDEASKMPYRDVTYYAKSKIQELPNLTLTSDKTDNAFIYAPDASATLNAALQVTHSGISYIYEWYLGENKLDTAADTTYTTGALDAGEHSFTVKVIASAQGMENVEKSQTITLTVNNATLTTVSAENAQKTYDGTPLAISLSGTADGDIITYSESENGEFLSDCPTLTDKGEKTVWYKVERKNYNAFTASATVKITPATLSVSVDDKTVYYGFGDNNSLGLTIAITGFVNGETAENIVDASGLNFENLTNNAAFTVKAHTGISASGLKLIGGNENYTFKYLNDGSLTVRPRKLTVTAKPNTVTYGSLKPETPYSVEYTSGEGEGVSAFASGESASGSIVYAVKNAQEDEYAAGSNVGSYNIIPSGLNMDNYEITFANGMLTVSPMSVDLTVSPDQSVIYGNAAPKLSATVGATYNNEKLNYTLVTAYTQGNGVGAYDITVELGENPNYSVNVINTNKLTVIKRDLTITAVGKTIYFGDAAPNFSVTYTNLYGNDLISYSAICSDYIQKTSGIGNYDITVTAEAAAEGYKNGNYNITTSNGTLKVDPISVNVVWTGLDNPFTYNGYAQASGITAKYTDINGKDVPAVITFAKQNTSPSVTEFKTAGLYELNATFAEDSNYELREITKNDIGIGKAGLNFTVAAPQAIEYGDAPNLTNLQITATNGTQFFGDDYASFVFEISCPTYILTDNSASDTDSYAISVVFKENPNYDAEYVEKKNLTVIAKFVDIEWGVLINDEFIELSTLADNYFIYTGVDQKTALSARYALIPQDGGGNANAVIKQGENAGWEFKNAGDYALSASISNTNYTPKSNSAQQNLNMAKAKLNVSVAATVSGTALTPENNIFKITYGDEVVFTVSYGDFVNGELAKDVIGGELTYICNYNLSSLNTRKVGEYTINSLDGLTSDNYEFVYDNSKVLTVEQKTISTLTWAGQNGDYIYNGKNQASSVTATFAPISQDGQTASADIAYKIDGTTADFINAAAYTLTASLSVDLAHNYKFAESGVTLTQSIKIKPVALTINITTPVAIEYGSVQPDFSVTYSYGSLTNLTALYNSDTIGLTFSCDYDLANLNTRKVGSYLITATVQTGNPNYSVSAEGGIIGASLAVNKKQVTATWTGQDGTFTYNKTNLNADDAIKASFPLISQDVQNNITQAYANIAFVGTTYGGKTFVNADTYTLTASIPDTDECFKNYELTATSATSSATIKPKDLTVSAQQNAITVYGTALDAFKPVSYDGLIEGDSITGLNIDYTDAVFTNNIFSATGNFSFTVSYGAGAQAAGFATAAAATGDDTNYNVTIPDAQKSGQITVEKKTVAVEWGMLINGEFTELSTWLTDNSFIYTGVAQEIKARYNVSLNDTPDWQYAAVAFAVGNRSAVEFKNAGTYALTATILDSHKDNYVLDTGSETTPDTTKATAEINKALLTVKANNDEITYGDNAPVFKVTYSGFVPDENSTNVTITGTPTFNTDYVKDAGIYYIKPVILGENEVPLLSADNYDFTVSETDGTLTVTKKAVTVTPAVISVTFGNAIPEADIKATFEGLLDGENINGYYEIIVNYAAGTTGANTYDNAITVALAEGMTHTNYDINVSATAKLTVTQREAAVVWNIGSYTYTGLAQSGGITAKYMLYNDTEGSPTGEAAIGFVKSGTSITEFITAGGYNLTATTSNNNYLLTNATNSAEIAKAPLTVTANNDEITYGDDAPAFGASNVTIIGFVNNETLAALGDTLSFTYSGYTAGSPVNADGYAITPGGLTSTNYEIKWNPGKLTVGTRKATITHETSAYEGSTWSKADWNVTNLYNGDTFSGTLTLTRTERGTYTYGGTENPFRWTTPAAVNNSTNTNVTDCYEFIYDIKVELVALGNITASEHPYSSVYDGLSHAGSVEITTVFPENVTPMLEYSVDNTNWITTAPEFKDVGNYTVYYRVTAEGFNDLNDSFTVAITKKDLTIKADDASATYGDSAPAFGVTYNGFENGETSAVLGGTLGFACDYDINDSAKRGVRTYDITPSGLTSTNYNISFAKGTLTVGKFAVTITPNDASVTFGDDITGLTSTLNKTLPYGDTISRTVSVPQYIKGTTGVGPHADYIKVTLDDTYANYDIDVSATAELTVTQREAAVVWNIGSYTYTGVLQSGGITAKYMLYNDTAGSPTGEAAIGFVKSGTSITEFITAGGYNLTATTSDGNYKLTNDTASAAITKAKLTVTAINKTLTYGNAFTDFTFTYEGFENGENESVITGTPTFETAYDVLTTNRNVGEYTITPLVSGLSANNYSFTPANGTLAVTARDITVTAVDKETTYGTAFNAFTVTFGGDGLYTGDVIGTIAYTCNYAIGNNAADYSIGVAVTNANANYNITATTNGTLTVKKRNLTINITPASVIYGLDASPFEAVYNAETGLFGSDTIDFELTCADYSIGTGVGAYDIVFTEGSAVGSEFKNANYNITAANGTLTVNPRPITVAANPQSVVYGTNPDSIEFVTYGGEYGLYGTDTLSGLNVTSDYTQGSGVITGGYPITVSYSTGAQAAGFAKAAAADANYAVTVVDSEGTTVTESTATLTVTKKAVTVTANNITDVIYGDAVPTLSATVGETYNGETLNYTLDTNYTRGSGVITGGYAITIALGDNPNYDISIKDGTLTVNKRTTEIIWNIAASYTYTGYSQIGGITAKYMLYDNSEVSAKVTVTQNGANAVFKDAGAYTFTATFLPVNTAHAENYTLTSTQVNPTIEKAQLNVSVTGNFAITYGDEKPVFTLAYSGFLGGDTANLSGVILGAPVIGCGYDQAVSANRNAGEYPIIISGGEAKNYTFIYNTTKKLAVGTFAVTITPSDASVTFGNDINISLLSSSLNIAALPYGDTISRTVSVPQYIKGTTGAGPHADYVKVTLDGAYANYDIDVSATATLTVNPRSVTVAANTLSVEYNAARPADSAFVTITGLYGTDVLNGLTITCGYTQGADAGISYDFTIAVNAQANPNYNVSIIPSTGTLTVTAKTVAVVWGNLTGYVYNGSVQTVTASYTDINGSVQTVTGFTFTGKGSEFLNAGDYTVTATFEPNPNYNLTNTSVPVTMAPAIPVSPSAVTGLTYDPNRLMSAIPLPDGWIWTAPNSTPTCNVTSYEARYNDTSGNYTTPTVYVSVTLTKAVVTLGYRLSAASPVTELTADANGNYIIGFDWTGSNISVEFVILFGGSVVVPSGANDAVTISPTVNEFTSAGTFRTDVSLTATNYMFAGGEASKTCYVKTKGVKIGNTLYTIEDALNAATSGTITVEFKGVSFADSVNGACYGNDAYYTLKSGVTLILPSDQDTSTTIGTPTYGAGTKAYVDNDAAKIQKTLIISNGVTFNVSGTILVQGLLGVTGGNLEGHTSGNHGQIINNGTINLNSGSKLDLRGFVKGTGILNANNGSYIYSPFVVRDFRGGTNTVTVYKKGNIAPFNVYEMPNIQCNAVYYYGMTYRVYLDLYALNAHQKSQANMISTVEATGNKMGVIRLHNGARVEKNYDRDILKTTLKIIGNATMGSLTLNISLGTAEMSTVYFPIPWTFDIFVGDGTTASSLSTQYDYKLLPGASLTICENAIFTLTGNLIVYSLFKDFKFSDTNEYLVNDNPSNKDSGNAAFPANFVVNGTFNLNKGFGGNIQSTVTGARVVVAATGAVLSLTSKEGNSGGTTQGEAIFNKGKFELVFQITESARFGVGTLSESTDPSAHSYGGTTESTYSGGVGLVAGTTYTYNATTGTWA